MCDLGLNRGPEKGHWWDNWWNWNKVCRLVSSTSSVVSPAFGNCTLFEEVGWEYSGTLPSAMLL